MYSEAPENLEQISDQAALPNLNSEWVNAKGESRLRIDIIRPVHVWDLRRSLFVDER